MASCLAELLGRYDLRTTDLEWECPREIRIKIAVKLIDWKVFGAYLGFPPEKVASIDADHRTEDQRKIALLDSWHEREGEYATCLKLAKVLHDRNRRDLICQLCQLTKALKLRGQKRSSSSEPISASLPVYGRVCTLDSMLDDSSDISEKIEELEQHFDSLHQGLLSDIKSAKDVSVEHLLQALTLLPISLRREYESSIQDKLPTLERIPTINGIFLRLNPLFSFIDYGLLEHLIRKFGSTSLKHEATTYVAKMEAFMSKTTVAQLINVLPGLDDLPADFSQIRVKFDEDPAHYTLKKLNRFRKNFCSHVRLSHFVMLLIRLESGSFYAVWHIPSILVPDLRKSGNWISDGFCRYECISSLFLDGEEIYSANVEADITSSTQAVLFQLDQEYLTCKRDGYYLEGRDYGIKAFIDSSTMLAQDLTTGSEFTISMVDSNSSILSECHTLSRLGKHSNVINFLGCVVDEEFSPAGPIHTCRVMFESTEDGSLADMLRDENNYEYPLIIDQSLYYLHQILNGVKFLHQNHVIHLDICAENLLLFGRGHTVKLCGFGKAVSADTNTSAVLKDSVHLSTFFCAAPEVIREEVPTTAADVWSVMCTMVHMITGSWTGCVESPKLAVTMLMLVGSYTDEKLQKLIPLNKLDIDLEVSQLFVDVFKRDPTLRPTAGELLKRPIIHLAQEFYCEDY